MGNIGLTVMINQLFGADQGADVVQGAVGKVIKGFSYTDDALSITFTDNTSIKVYDDGQSCCEHRYMVIDDDLAQFVGATLTGVEVRNAPDVEDGGEAHEVQFLEVQTSLGVVSIANHNEHNGYYGGFWMKVERVE